MNIMPSGLTAGTLVTHRMAPTTQWTVVKDTVGGVMLSGTDTKGKTVKIVVPAYFLVKV
jgi:hypothetical protein